MRTLVLPFRCAPRGRGAGVKIRQVCRGNGPASRGRGSKNKEILDVRLPLEGTSNVEDIRVCLSSVIFGGRKKVPVS